jgi:hypothetical protein
MNYSTPNGQQITPAAKPEQELFNIISCPLDQRLYSASPAVKFAARSLCDEIDSLGNKRRMRTKPYNGMRRFFVCLLVNFFDTWVTYPTCHIAVKLGKDDYKESDYAYAAVRDGMRGLEALGYVSRTAHHWDSIKLKGLVTRFKATEKLTAVFAAWDLSIVQFNPRSPLVEIRPKGKVRRWAARRNEHCPTVLPWPNAERGTRAKMIRNLLVLNRALNEQFQSLALPDDELRTALGRNKLPVNLRRQALHRTFLEDPQHGGRFVGPYWQSIKRELRQHIRMAAPGQQPQETVELDFDSLHPAMLYATRKSPVNGDLYGIYDSAHKNAVTRPAVKPLLLTMINADSERDAKNSFKETVNTEIYPKWVKETWGQTEPAINPFGDIEKKLAEMYPGCPGLDLLMKDIKKHHYRISEYFCSGAGRWLMFEDSQISEMIMLSMYREHGVVPLPNHDSYIVPAHYGSALKSTMERMFSARFAGVTPKITPKDCSVKPYTYLDDSHLYSKLLRQWQATNKQAALAA